jgi:oligopeptide transport system substrate-binding protein
MWRPLGVDVMLNNTEGKVLFARLRTGDFEIGYAGWVADVNDAGNFLSILDSRAKNSNYARFNSRAYDALLDQAAETIDLSERALVLAEAEALMLSETPIAPLFYGVSKSLVGSHVSGWIDNPRDVHLSRYVNVARRAALND